MNHTVDSLEEWVEARRKHLFNDKIIATSPRGRINRTVARDRGLSEANERDLPGFWASRLSSL
jgi:hypothetical protein